MKKLVSKLVAAAFVAALLAVSASAKAAMEWNLATPYPDKVFHTVNIKMFAKEVEERTNGEVKITVHAAASLFKHSEIKRAVRTGQVEMGEIQLSHFANENELFNFGTIPFMATTFEEAMLAWQAANPVIERILMKEGIRVLYAVPWPPQAFYARKKLDTVADMKDLKFRTYNRIGSRMAELLGAQPVLVSGAEVSQAFASGLIEAMVTSSAFGASIQAWDFVKYFHDTRAWLGVDEILVNERAFQSLSPKAQQVMLEAAAKAQERGLRLGKEANDASKKILADHGVVLVEPSAEFMKAARAATATMVDEWIEKAGPEAKAIVEEYNRLRLK